MVIALGANEGDASTQLKVAAEQLAQRFDDLRCSSWWRTPPVGCPPGSPDFINGVVVARRPERSASSVLEELQALEHRAGRRQAALRNAPRVLDLDLILFGNTCMRSPQLELPHPRALQRRFVLEPLAELAAALIWPTNHRTVAECLAAAPPLAEMQRMETNT